MEPAPSHHTEEGALSSTDILWGMLAYLPSPVSFSEYRLRNFLEAERANIPAITALFHVRACEGGGSTNGLSDILWHMDGALIHIGTGVVDRITVIPHRQAAMRRSLQEAGTLARHEDLFKDLAQRFDAVLRVAKETSASLSSSPAKRDPGSRD